MVRTKNLLLPAMVTAMLMFFSCKKIVQQQQQNIIENAITTGYWYVVLYKQDTADLTSNFQGYNFQFYTNSDIDSVKAYLNNVPKAAGTWSTDVSNYTITASFPAGANDTLKLLNHTWKITDSYLDSVAAKTNTGSSNNLLNLKKR